MVLTEKQVAGLWVHCGGPLSEAAMCVAVATEESHRDTDIVNPQSGATGLMQIHPGGEQYKDPVKNMTTAVGKWKARGWQPWSVCGSGPWSAGEARCPKLAAKANAVARRINAPRAGQTRNASVITDALGKAILGPANPWADDLGDLLDGTVGKVTGPLGDLVPDAIGKPVEGLAAVAAAIQDVFNLFLSLLKKLADPNTWGDVLKILVGLILLYMGFKRTFELTKA